MSADRGHLDDLVISAFQNQLGWPESGVDLILGRLAKLGITMTGQQIAKLKNDLEDEELDELVVELDDEQEQQLRSSRGEGSETIDLDFDALDNLEQHIDEAVAQIIADVVQDFSETLLNRGVR